MVQELHRHSFFYVLILKNGSGKHKIDFISYSVTDHSVFFMRPGQVHELTLINGSCGYLIEFTNDFYSPLERDAAQVLRRVSNKNYCPLNIDRFNKLLFILDNIFQECADKHERYLEVIHSNLNIFFIELLRQSQNPKDILNNNSDLYMQGRLEELQELIMVNFSEHKETAYYAEKLNLTTYQLNSIAKSALGKTCSEIIIDYILLEAKRYLLATGNQINQIAWRLGYEDVSYFIRFFKKHTGLSPEAFREKFR